MVDNLDKQLKKLAKKLNSIAVIETARATSYALNRAISKDKTRVIKEISKKEKIQSKIVRKYVYISKATAKNQRSKISVYARPIPAVSMIKSAVLIGKRTTGTNKKGVRVAGRQFDGAFINVVRKTGRFHVLERKGAERRPIDVVSIPISKSAARSIGRSPYTTQPYFKSELKRDLMRRIQKYRV